MNADDHDGISAAVASMTLDFVVPPIPSHGGWGPIPPSADDPSNPSTLSPFAGLPYAPYARSDRLGRISADFTSSGNVSWREGRGGGRDDHRGGRGGRGHGRNHNQQNDDPDGQPDGNEAFAYRMDDGNGPGGGGGFVLVDSAASGHGGHHGGRGRGFGRDSRSRRAAQQARMRLINARAARTLAAAGGPGSKAGAVGAGDEDDPINKMARYNQPQRTRRRNNFGGRGRGGRGWARDRQFADRQASVKVGADWKVAEEFDLIKLNKLSTTAPKGEDLLWCGHLDRYNDVYDRVSTRSSVPLKRTENKEFYPVTTTDDPVIEKLAIEGAGNVFATDAILAHLMASARSIYPWDVVIQKLPGDVLFFDKRDASQFDFLTVSETAYSPPAKSDDDPNGINTPDRLSLEATTINQNFSQQILKTGSAARKNFDHPNPFFDEDDADGMEPASVAYRYRRFALGESIRLVCRCELHGVVSKGGGDKYMTAFALNEWDPALSGGISWREKIDSQRGAVLATEIKNNSCKVARWTAQSILSGADQMKVGFVSRTNKTNAYEHAIIGTQFYRPVDLAMQTAMSVGNIWGVIKMLVDMMMGKPEGKYVLMRDPNRPVVRIYSVPPGTFEDDDDSDEEDEAGAVPTTGAE
eukprot:CAMPEP_0194266726 /NCGR_PEP_ID=MMETSP0169-20130528/1538_1 /TAXON_ID=218684 /ORGANISM="Corethron pennatum, Strain L29A3" /LENGTH=638 /DNA_ID=CAMNT_0039007481 /DNA_START=55 /DNA_END=1971 /DNA_ORIENTATION=-